MARSAGFVGRKMQDAGWYTNLNSLDMKNYAVHIPISTNSFHSMSRYDKSHKPDMRIVYGVLYLVFNR